LTINLILIIILISFAASLIALYFACEELKTFSLLLHSKLFTLLLFSPISITAQIILSCISQHNFNQIKLIQKKAIRIITRSTYTAHTDPLFAQLQILPYELILKQEKLLFMHSIEYDYALTSFRGIWNKNYLNQGDRPLRNADDYTLPNPRTELFKKSPLYTLTLEWNNLDENRYIRNRTTFKTTLKYNLLSSLMDGSAAHGIEPWPALDN
jgi:hypothetical protein